VFIFVGLGAVMAASGLSIFRLLSYLREELFITLGASSSDPALPGLMEKMEHLGLSRQHVGLVVPSGYVFNTDGTAIYMATTAIFIAQALGIDLTWQQQAEMLAVAMVTSRGRAALRARASSACWVRWRWCPRSRPRAWRWCWAWTGS
jgi:aerobic C4-dicarboxylate transport protein